RDFPLKRNLQRIRQTQTLRNARVQLPRKLRIHLTHNLAHANTRYLAAIHTRVRPRPHGFHTLNTPNPAPIPDDTNTLMLVFLITRIQRNLQTLTTRLKTTQHNHASEDSTQRLFLLSRLKLSTIIVLVPGFPSASNLLKMLDQHRPNRRQIHTPTIRVL